MEDESPPKKIGSLRDRIAAFEKSSATQQPSIAPPPPRPKPGGISWKPKQPSPPSTPIATESGHESVAAKAGGSGMSAADAKESIGQGVSLKERMAALQGRGAFGAPAPATPPPKPTSDKPKWKPPPQIIRSPSPTAENDQPDQDEPVERQVDENAEDKDEEESVEPREVDPEEEARQRRAAIAARMQRLGGSKIGMAPPPILGAKPAWKKPSLPKEEGSVQSPPKEGDEQRKESTDSNHFDQSTTEAPTSNLPEETPLSTSSAGSKSPSMPVPAVPRRTAPPRRKPGKTTVVESDEQSPPPDVTAEMGETKIVEKEEVVKETPPFLESTPAVVNEEGEGGDVKFEAVVAKSVPVEEESEEQQEDEHNIAHQGSLVEEKTSSVELDAATDYQKMDSSVNQDESLSSAAIEEKERERDEMDAVAVGEKDIDTFSWTEQPEDASHHDSVQLDSTAEHESESFGDEETKDEEEEEDEEDETTRRARIAERLAQSGGINPLAAGASFASPPPPPLNPVSKSSVDFEAPSRKGSLNIRSPPSTKTSVDVDESLPVRKVSADGHEVREEDVVEEADDKESERIREQHLATDFHYEERNEDKEDDYNLSGASEYQDAISKQSFEEDHESRRSSSISFSQERYEDTEYDTSPPRRISVPPPPPIPVSSRPTPKEEELPPPPLPSGRRIQTAIPPPPPPTALRPSAPMAKQEQKELDVPPPPPLPAKPLNQMFVPPPPPLQVDEVEGLSHPLPLNPAKRPKRPSVPVPPPTLHTEVGYGTTSPPQPPPVTRPSVPPPHKASRAATKELSSARRTSVPVPPQAPSSARSSYDEQRSESSFIDDDYSDRFGLPRRSNDVPPAPTLTIETEILDDSDGDPIDPVFLSPAKSPRKGKQPQLPPVPPPPPLPLEDDDKETTPTPVYPPTPHAVQVAEEDEERSKRSRLAERMAKLGGIKFGTAPPVPRPPPGHREEESVVSESQQTEDEQKERRDEGGEESEADEQARRARIAAKLAGMGGMRFGMFSPGGPGGPPSRPPPPPAEAETISEDEGVQVEAEESEMEEVRYEDAEESPPPVPAREARQSPSAPRRSLSSVGRPPVPGPTMARKPSVRDSSVDSTGSYRPLPKAIPSQSEYVMVEEPGVLDQESAPPPPPRIGRAPPPPRSLPQLPPPPPPPPPSDVPDSLLSSQWELPSIPSGSLDFGAGMGMGTGDLDLSSSTWSDDSTSYPVNPNRTPSSSPPVSHHTSRQQQPPPGHAEAPLGADQLNAAWNRVGVQICEAAAELYDKSKKNLIGDGTYIGFINAVLTRVPNASPLEVYSDSSLGYLIYAQTGNAVHKRSADIMSGDIITLQEAKLKGHKGLQTYHQSVGEGERLIGIVGEFDVKKSKVRVYQANQHVGQQTVEFVSYRLDDLKSGSVKIYRVLES